MEIKDNLKNSLEREQGNATIGLLEKVYAELPPPGYNLIMHKQMISENTTCPDTVQENLWEHAKLNMLYGLYRVNGAIYNEQPKNAPYYAVKTGDVFQIRGSDLANMTLVFDSKGWIVMDVLTSSGVAEEAWREIVQKYLNDKPITAVIYSHTHVDHYGGVGGLKEFFADNCKIYAPKGFTEHAVSENIYVGTAMRRRGMYQYGSYLEPGVNGHVDCGLGTLLSTGKSSIIKPDIFVSDTENTTAVFNRGTCDELMLQFQYTPGTEAPAEMNVYIAESNVLFIAENCCGTLHNILTPRGAQVRDPLAWANYLDQTLQMFPDVESLCSSHNWPRFRNEEYKSYIELQMDMYRFINNATLHLANRGYTINEVGRILEKHVPQAIDDDWCCRGFYGTYNHNAKAVYQRYIGWYDGNPAHLNQLMPTERANRYVGTFKAENILHAANAAKDKAIVNKDTDSAAWAVELYDHLLNADKGVSDDIMDEVRAEYAKALQMLGYASEAATWRNMYLTAAQEVEDKDGFAPFPHEKYLNFEDETIKAMSLDMILQYMSIMLNFKQPITGSCLLLAVSLDDDQNEEYAAVWYRNNILYYRIVGQEDISNYNDDAVYTVKCSKLDFFKAFIEHNKSLLDQMVTAKSGDDVIAPSDFFTDDNFTRFTTDFPIMTRRDPF